MPGPLARWTAQLGARLLSSDSEHTAGEEEEEIEHEEEHDVS